MAAPSDRFAIPKMGQIWEWIGVGFGHLTGALRVRLVEGGRYKSDSEQQPPPSPGIKPGNIAYAGVFLASEDSGMITGHILPVDRGIGAEAQLLIDSGPSR